MKKSAAHEMESSYTFLPDGVSLQVLQQGKVIFASSGKWLHPLFEVEDFLKESDLDAAELFLHDKIAGRAASSIITRMGFRKCRIDLVSSHALEVFSRYGIACQYKKSVERIDCRTEDMITPEMDLQSVYLMIKKRAGRIHGVSLSIKNLKAGYNDQVVLDGLNLELVAGERLVIVGDNGAGKSTLLKILIGAVLPESGEVFLDGRKIVARLGVPSGISYVSQQNKNSIMPITVDEIVAAGLIGKRLSSKERAYQVEIALRQTGSFHLAGRSVHLLSGGERQRVSLARCLAQKAGLMLLDEPTSFLDQEAKEELLELLQQIAASTMPSILLVSHDHEWVKRLGWPVSSLKEGTLCLN